MQTNALLRSKGAIFVDGILSKFFTSSHWFFNLVRATKEMSHSKHIFSVKNKKENFLRSV